MRSFLAALALLLAGVVGTVALTAYVASQTALSTDSSGRMLSSALQQPRLRHRVLAAVVPGYDSLPSPVQDELNRIAEDPRVRSAVAHVRIDAHGTVHLSRLRHRIEQQLRANGQAPAADLLASAGGPDTVQLPAPVAHPYSAARRTARLVARAGAAVAVVLLLLALLVSPHRRRTLGAVGWTILASCVASALLWWGGPALARAFSHPLWAAAATAATRTYTSTVVSTLVPVAVAGAALLVVSLLVPSRQRA